MKTGRKRRGTSGSGRRGDMGGVGRVGRVDQDFDTNKMKISKEKIKVSEKDEMRE